MNWKHCVVVVDYADSEVDYYQFASSVEAHLFKHFEHSLLPDSETPAPLIVAVFAALSEAFPYLVEALGLATHNQGPFHICLYQLPP